MNNPHEFVETKGDLLDPPVKLHMIVHQCNCFTVGEGAGLARAIFSRWPETSIYTPCHPGRMPGGVILGHASNGLIVANLLGQYKPGSCDTSDMDNEHIRIFYFHSALFKLATVVNSRLWQSGDEPFRIGFPYKIGCGLAGGHWPLYRKSIMDFASLLSASNAQVFILQKE